MLNRLSALLALIVLSPFMAAISVIVRILNGRPVFFRHQRAGLKGIPFDVLKFRTMRPPRVPNEADQYRITRFGRFLRKSSLDELPSLWNVVRGEMNLVGPRPLPIAYTPLYTPEQARRLEVKPGLTGLLQVRGRNALNWAEKFALDTWYVKNRTWRLDLRILAETPLAILRGSGVSHPGHVTMPVFTGSGDGGESEPDHGVLKDNVARPTTVLVIDPGGELGGAERVLDTIVRLADSDRFRPIVACLGEGSWPKSLADDGFTVQVISRGRLRDLRTVGRVIWSLTAYIRREKVAVVHASLASAVIYGAVAGRLAGSRVIWHLHDPQGTQGFRRRVFVGILTTFGADHVIFGNVAAQAGWRAILSGKAIPSSTILPGVDLDQIACGNATAARTYLGIPADAPVISMFARAVHYKGHADLVKAAAIVKNHVPSCRFVICTGWTDKSDVMDNLCQLVSDLGLKQTVLLPGGVSEEVKNGLLQTSLIVAHPSWFEPYGLAILEGMAAGKPVVAARSDGAQFLLSDGVTGLIVPPRNPDALAVALISLLDNRDQCENMGSKARERAGNFTNTAMVRAVEDIWITVAERSSAFKGHRSRHTSMLPAEL